MRRISTIAALLGLGVTLSTRAQQPAAAAPAPTAPKTLAASMNVYVFPTTGQTASQQSSDESACYQWAVQNTGTDPFQAAKQAEAQKQQSQQQAAQASQGSGARGAARGAAAGALVGGVAGDAGKGAAVGATAGAVSGRRKGKQAQAQADQQTAQTQAATAQQIDNFKKAFSACLEGKKYQVKF
jgi:hypothetical protein